MGITAALAAIATVGAVGAGTSIASSDKANREASRARDKELQKLEALPTDVANENTAQKSAERRRRMYAGIGRSSTILTGPSGLGSLGDSNQAPKQLLGI